jgi:RNA polymerase sigma factor (sigma-70 family)
VRAEKQTAVDRMLTEYAAHPLLSRLETEALLSAAQAGDIAARNELIRCNMRLVMREAIAQARAYGVDVEDLIAAGVYGAGAGSSGLSRAIDRFDLSRNVRFSTYAAHWIRAGINVAIDGMRLHKRRLEQPLGVDSARAVANTGPLPDACESRERPTKVKVLADVVATLPPADRALVEAAYLTERDQMRVVDLARELGMHRNTASHKHKLVLARLRVRLSARGITDGSL